MMELAELRSDTIFKPQRRKNPAHKIWKQREIAGADFETKDGYPHIYTWTQWKEEQWHDFHFIFGGTVNEPEMFLEANGGVEHPPFSIITLLNIHHQTGYYSQGGYGSRKTPPQLYFFNLKYDAQAIIKTLPDDVILQLMEGNDCYVDTWEWQLTELQRLKKKNRKGKNFQIWATMDDQRIDNNRYVRLAYLPKKFLSIEPIRFFTDGVKWVKLDCWDIAQFCGRGSLDFNAKKHLGEGKLDFNKEEMSLLGSLSAEGVKFTQDNWQKIIEYAEKDANLTARLSWKIVNGFEQNRIRMVRPFSTAAVAERAFLDRCDIPTMNDLMADYPELCMAFWTGYQGGHFEATGAGLWMNAEAGDITSAYPHVLWWCVDHTDGFWIGTFHGDPESEAADYLEKHIMYRPAMFEAEVIFPEGLEIYPAAKKSGSLGCLVNARVNYGWFTGDEIKEFKEWGAEIEIERWCAFIPNEDNDPAEDVQDGIRYPYRPALKIFYGGKLEQDKLKGTADYDPELREQYKLQCNSIYGKQCQAVEKSDGFRHTGTLWNPINAAVITAGCRMRMAEVIRHNGFKGVLSVATDGIIFDAAIKPEWTPNPMPVHFDGELINLGDWEDDGSGILLLLMSGVYSLIMGEKSKTTYRGTYSLFLDYRDENNELVKDLYGEEHLEFCSRFSEAERVERNEDSDPFSRPYSLGEAKMKKDFSLTNQFRVVPLAITACGDSNKRRWEEKPQTFGDLKERWWPSFSWESMI
jgi:hypothetical protein